MTTKRLSPLDMGGSKIANAANGTASTDLATVGQTVAVANVLAYGADPTGSSDSSSAFNSAFSALPSTGGVVYAPPGTYKITSGITMSLGANQTVVIQGAGAQATVLSYHGSGDCLRMYNGLAFGSGGGTSWYSGVKGLTIDGTNGTGSPVGLHAGDITHLQMRDLVVQNFTGASSIGIHLDNTVTWTEECDIRATIDNCTKGMALDVTTGFNSFGYSNLDLTFFQTGAQSCLCVLNGAFLYHSAVRMRGDVTGSATTLSGNPAVIYVGGQAPSGTPDAGGNPGIQACHLDVLVEPNNLSGTATHFMSTFYLDNSTSFGFVVECYGLLDFGIGTGALTPISTTMLAGNGNNFTSFSGIINGDSNLNPSGVVGWNLTGSGSILNYMPGASAFDGYFPTQFTDTFFTTLDGSDATFALNFSGIGNGDTLPGPQRKLMFIKQPASGGPFSLNFVVAGSATVASPTINWAGGAPPQLSTVPNGLDVVEVLTWDGATWYGRHLRSYGTATSQVVSLRPEVQRVTLTTAFNSATGTSAQNVTGLSATLLPGTYKVTAWVPMGPHGTTASTQTLQFTFGGTASTSFGKWTITGPSSSTQAAGAATVASAASPTMTSTGLIGEFAGHVTVTASGTLQLTVKSTTSGDEVTIPVGSYIDIERVG